MTLTVGVGGLFSKNHFLLHCPCQKNHNFVKLFSQKVINPMLCWVCNSKLILNRYYFLWTFLFELPFKVFKHFHCSLFQSMWDFHNPLLQSIVFLLTPFTLSNRSSVLVGTLYFLQSTWDLTIYLICSLAFSLAFVTLSNRPSVHPFELSDFADTRFSFELMWDMFKWILKRNHLCYVNMLVS